MLIVDEAVQKVLVEEGLILTPPQLFKYDQDRLNDLFRMTVEEHSQHYPRRISQEMHLDRGGTPLNPPAIEVAEVKIKMPRPSRFNPFQFVYQTVKRDSWDFDGTLVSCQVGGTFKVVYIAKYDSLPQDVSYDISTLHITDTEVSLALRSVPKIATLSLSAKDAAGVEFVANAIGNGAVIVGDLGAAIYDDELNKLNLTLQIEAVGRLRVSYQTANLGVNELSLSSADFLKLFKSNLMMGMGSLKSLLKIESLPVDFSADDLITRAKELRDQYINAIPERGRWWEF